MHTKTSGGALIRPLNVSCSRGSMHVSVQGVRFTLLYDIPVSAPTVQFISKAKFRTLPHRLRLLLCRNVQIAVVYRNAGVSLRKRRRDFPHTQGTYLVWPFVAKAIYAEIRWKKSLSVLPWVCVRAKSLLFSPKLLFKHSQKMNRKSLMKKMTYLELINHLFK